MFALAMLLNVSLLPGFLTPSPGSAAPVTMHGEDAFRLLTGNTLRAVGEKGAPTYRYFMSEHLEYHCLNLDLSGVKQGERDMYAGAAGCTIYYISMKDGRLCESSTYLRCQNHELKLTFHSQPAHSKARNNQVLGLVSLPATGSDNGTDPVDHDLIKGDYELIRGNATIFPDFSPEPRPKLVEVNSPDGKLPSSDIGGCLGERRVSTLPSADAISKLTGNTLVSLGRDGKFDGQTAEYFDPNGQVVFVTLPRRPPESSDVLHPSSDARGMIFVNRWKVEGGKLCRTENDDPARFLCGTPFAIVQRPEAAGVDVPSRICVRNTALKEGFLAEGNVLVIGVSKSTGRN
jgi:hypothetical protein